MVRHQSTRRGAHRAAAVLAVLAGGAGRNHDRFPP
jgi:hypothetical protein